MQNDKLVLEKANTNNWSSILTLLSEADLTSWFTGNESPDNFYIIKNLILMK